MANDLLLQEGDAKTFTGDVKVLLNEMMTVNMKTTIINHIPIIALWASFDDKEKMPEAQKNFKMSDRDFREFCIENMNLSQVLEAMDLGEITLPTKKRSSLYKARHLLSKKSLPTVPDLWRMYINERSDSKELPLPSGMHSSMVQRILKRRCEVGLALDDPEPALKRVFGDNGINDSHTCAGVRLMNQVLLEKTKKTLEQCHEALDDYESTDNLQRAKKEYEKILKLLQGLKHYLETGNDSESEYDQQTVLNLLNGVNREAFQCTQKVRKLLMNPDLKRRPNRKRRKLKKRHNFAGEVLNGFMRNMLFY